MCISTAHHFFITQSHNRFSTTSSFFHFSPSLTFIHLAGLLHFIPAGSGCISKLLSLLAFSPPSNSLLAMALSSRLLVMLVDRAPPSVVSHHYSLGTITPPAAILTMFIVDPNTPRDGSRRNPFQQDSTRFRGAAKASCGETLAVSAHLSLPDSHRLTNNKGR